MPNLDKALNILEKALAEWRKQQTLKQGKISVTAFAEYLGYSQQIVNFWLNKDQPISENAITKIAPKLAELLSNEIYTELEIEKPDILYNYIKDNWKNISKDKKDKIVKVINDQTGKPIPNEQKTKPTKL